MQLTEKSIKLPVTNFYFWLLSALFLFITALLAGMYPAFYLSSFQPIKVLKGSFSFGKICILSTENFSGYAICGFGYSNHRYCGRISANKVCAKSSGWLQQGKSGGGENCSTLISEIINRQLKKLYYQMELLVKLVFHPARLLPSGIIVAALTGKEKTPGPNLPFSVTWVNEDFGKTIHWKIKQGRDYSKDYGTDSSAVIINESAAKYLGFKNPIGEFITFDADGTKRQIIGVVEDIVAESPFEPVRIGFYWLQKNLNHLGQMYVKINPDLSMNVALPKMEAIIKKIAPAAPFQYQFTNEEYERKFSAEQKISNLSTIFAALAIFISCLGIFGLASFVAEQRAREIGIRKVLGASVSSLWQLLSRDFVVLVVISCMIAIPVANYFMNNWLNGYQYRTEISWWIFAAAGFGALFITLLTVSFQAIKAAIANPVESLRTE